MCVFFFHFFWGLGWERRGRKCHSSVSPEQRELLCGWVPGLLQRWVGPSKGRQGKASSGKIGFNLKLFRLSSRNKKSWITCRGHREKGRRKHTHTHPNYEIKYSFLQDDLRYKLPHYSEISFQNPSISQSKHAGKLFLRDCYPALLWIDMIFFSENWSYINNKPCCCWVG